MRTFKIKDILRMEGVYDLTELTPQEAISIYRLESDNDGVHQSLIEFQFPIAFGLWTFCSHWHGGQDSELYAIMSELEVSNVPHPLEDDDQHVYDLLEAWAKVEYPQATG